MPKEEGCVTGGEGAGEVAPGPLSCLRAGRDLKAEASGGRRRGVDGRGWPQGRPAGYMWT